MKYQERTYEQGNSCVFRSTRDAFGGLSNMASGYPVWVNGVKVPSSEALYQACRFPHDPDLQQEIVEQNSGMSAKMKSKSKYVDSRPDWENVRVPVMRWCLRVKLAQNFGRFGHLLERTGELQIVEDSKRDQFWGAVRQENRTLVGVNALGRLLMELRGLYNSPARYHLLFVSNVDIDHFCLFGQPVRPVDARPIFIEHLLNEWCKSELDTVDREFTRCLSKFTAALPNPALAKPDRVPLPAFSPPAPVPTSEHTLPSLFSLDNQRNAD
jgi:ribA/ribD-fused uncharacterized protein